MISKKWEEKDIEYLKCNFLRLSNKELGEKLNRTETAIRVKLRKLNCFRESKYTYNKDFFEEIDSEEKAYWLGFIYADGYVYNANGTYELGIQLKQSDSEHLKKLNKSLNGNINVDLFDVDNVFGNNKVYPSCSIRIYCKKMILDLEKNGVVQNKTKIIELPNIKNNLMIHFIRGYFDGDGCLRRNKDRNSLSFDFCSASEKMLEGIRIYIYENHEINSYICVENKENCITNYRLNIRGLRNGYKFGCLLYDNSKIYLDRKFKLFNTLVEEYNIKERIYK